MRSALLFALVALLLGGNPSAAAAQEPAPSRDQVRALLSGYEHVPDAETFRSLGPGAIEVLARLHRDPREAGFVRLRAIEALGAFRTARVREVLLRIARDAKAPPLFARQAVLALGQAFEGAAVDDLEPFLRHGDPLVRRATARALARTRTDAGRRCLREHLRHEEDASVRRAIERMLTDPPG
ncbi:MAG: HEAT repeat domain-containing protein [Myxococcota bacterium]